MDQERVLVRRADLGGLERELRVHLGVEKSSERRCVSRGSSFVPIEAAWTVPRAGAALLADLEGALELVEGAPHRGEAQVLAGELDGTCAQRASTQPGRTSPCS